MKDQTLDYYDKNARAFAGSTCSLDFHEVQDIFLGKIPAGSRILDLGCGSGRDTRYFLDHGYRVDPVDGSREMCRLAEKYAGVPVRQMLFSDLDARELYEGVWACSSILHLPKGELRSVFALIIRALKKKGVLYASFKYGEFEGMRNGRYFTDFTRESFSEFIRDEDRLSLEESWITGDVRPQRGEEKWLNCILRKI